MTSSIPFSFAARPVRVRRLNTSRPTGVDAVCVVDDRVYALKQQGKIAVIYTENFRHLLRRYQARHCYASEHEVAGTSLIVALGHFKLVDAKMALDALREAKWQVHYDSKLQEIEYNLQEVGLSVDDYRETLEATARAYADKMVK